MHVPAHNPYAPPAAGGRASDRTDVMEVPLPGQRPVATLMPMGHGKHCGVWRIDLFEDRIAVVAPDEEVRLYIRSAIAATFRIHPTGEGGLLIIEDEKITLRLDSGDLEAFRCWLGADLDKWAAELSLRSTKWSLVFGVALCAVVVVYLSPILLVLAVAYLVAGVGRLVAPGRWLFVLAAMRSVGMIGAIVFDLFVLDASWWLAVFGVLFVLGANMSWRRYRFFGSTPRSRVIATI